MIDMKKKSQTKTETSLSLQTVDNIEDFQIKDVDTYPNNLTCYLKMKIIDKVNIKGTGCLISPKYLLTAAHNIAQIDEYLKLSKLKKEECQQKFSVKQAMKNKNSKCQYRVIGWKKAQNYVKKGKDSIRFDYALMILQPLNNEQMETQNKFMPVIAMDRETLQKVQQLQVYGYPVPVNQKVNEVDLNQSYSVRLNQSSIYMANMYGAIGSQYDPKKSQKSDKKQVQLDQGIKYLLPTDHGISGGAIVTQYKGEPVIIGVHKGTNVKKKNNTQIKSKQEEIDKEQYNVGVNAKQMLEQLNQWGYELEKKPFVYTERTLSLRQNDKIINSQILFLLNKSLQKEDILVITAFDLKHVKSITLTGNHIKEEGLLYLTKRQYPNLQSLFLTDNQIQSLEKLPQQHWKNISTLKTLGLSVNSLVSLPGKITLLENIQRLWITFNKFTQIPLSLCELCENAKSQKPKIFVYKNCIKRSIHDQNQNRLQKTKAEIIWQKQPR